MVVIIIIIIIIIIMSTIINLIISLSQSLEIAHSTVAESDVIKSGHDRYDPMIEMAFFKQVMIRYAKSLYDDKLS
jgi:hypothetical protein